MSARAFLHELHATASAVAHRAREDLHTLATVRNKDKGPSPGVLEATAIPHVSAGIGDEDAMPVARGPAPAYSYDLAFRFIAASGLPQMDVGGLSDPYFVATLDDKISYTSSVQTHTLAPVWNEQWCIKNVPEGSTLFVKVFDKDDDTPRDDYIGAFKCDCKEGAREMRIESSAGAQMGTFWLEVKSTPTIAPNVPPFTFDGPVNFSRHFNTKLGLLAGAKTKMSLSPDPDSTVRETELPSLHKSAHGAPGEPTRRHPYSSWKLHLKGVPMFFGNEHQHWNVDYKPGQKIFKGPAIVRAGIQTAHRILYARTSMNEFGLINDADDFWRLMAPLDAAPDSSHTANPTATGVAKGFQSANVKAVVYTYVIGSGDDMFRFSETGAAFFTDFMSKHALHANCAETVRYSGEFHPHPAIEGGWSALGERAVTDEIGWEFWIDNASGTYSPDPKLLPALQKLLEYNFPGIKVRVFDYHSEELAKSKEQAHQYFQAYQGVAPQDAAKAAKAQAGKSGGGAGEESFEAGSARAAGQPGDKPAEAA